MVILTLEQLEPYRDFRISGVKSILGVPGNNLYKMQTREQRLLDQGSEHGLPYDVALRLHVNRESISDIGMALDIRDSYCLSKMLKYYKIPTFSKSEVARRNYRKESNGNRSTVHSSEQEKSTMYSNPLLPIGSMKSKECPRCSGDLFLLGDRDGVYYDCAQCGYTKDVAIKHDYAAIR